MERDLASTFLHIVHKRLTVDLADQVRECLQTLDQDQIWWRPNEGANSVGNLILHLCGSNRSYLLGAIQGEDLSRDRDREFAERTEISKEELMRSWNEMIAMADKVLSGLSPERLMEITERTGKPTTFAQILYHVSVHVADHVGQIVYVTKMLKEGSIQELWMKNR